MKNKNTEYQVGDRVMFMVREPLSVTYKHIVGYVKQVRKYWLLKPRYCIVAAKSDEMYIVSERDIFGVLKLKDK